MNESNLYHNLNLLSTRFIVVQPSITVTMVAVFPVVILAFGIDALASDHTYENCKATLSGEVHSIV